MTSQILSIKSVSKRYRDKLVLDAISLCVNQGEIVALLGENGAGKSTLINIINGLASPTSGSVALAFDKGRIGVMLQGNIVLSRVKVREALQLARSYHKNPLSYERLIKLSNLTGQENVEVTRLSGGQKRMLSFALALSGNPDFVFLDEPTTGMDSEHRAEFWRTIVDFQAEGKTFFVTSHYLEELETIASRILLLNQHKIAFDGTLAALRSQNAQSEISFNLRKDTLPKLTHALSIAQTGTFYRLTTNDTNALVRELVPLLDKLSNLTVKQNSLDSIFQSIIKNENEEVEVLL